MRSFLLALLFTHQCARAQQACSYSMRFFDVDECERFNTPFVQTTIIADGECRGQSTGPTGPGPFYQAVCGNDRIFFLKANCRDSACNDCDDKPRYNNNFDGDGWSPKSPCIPLPESGWSFNIKSGSCDLDKCAVPITPPSPLPRSEWPTWYTPTASPQTRPPVVAGEIISTSGPTVKEGTNTNQPSATQPNNTSPEAPTITATLSPNQTPTATTTVSPNHQSPTTTTASTNQNPINRPISSSSSSSKRQEQTIWVSGVLLWLVFSFV